MGRTLSEDERERLTAEMLWLDYFNKYLYERGTITEREYKRMVEMIAMRKPKPPLHRREG